MHSALKESRCSGGSRHTDRNPFQFPTKIRLVDEKKIWNDCVRASRVLTFAWNWCCVGHLEVTNDENERYWMLGFLSFDRLPREANWFDIGVAKNFSDFASKFQSFLESQPTTRPLTYSADFYRVANSSRQSSSGTFTDCLIQRPEILCTTSCERRRSGRLTCWAEQSSKTRHEHVLHL